MKIAVDLRSLSSGSISGVENYALGLLEHLLAMDKKNEYVLFYNNFKNGWNPTKEFHFVNVETTQTHIPNKLLNAALKMNFTNLEKLTGPVDCMFLPNLNQFSILPNTKLVLTVHDLSPVVTPEFYNLKRRLWHKFLNYKRAFERADLLFAVSEYTNLDLQRLFNVPASKIKVVYPGVDTRNYSAEIEPSVLREARNKYELPGNFLLFLSTIEPRKNLGNLIKAFEMLESPVNLVIAGKNGWKYSSIFQSIKSSKKFAKIKYIGYIPEADKPIITKLAQAVIYPSFYEGFGFVPVEAMSLGVPVVASAVTSIPEVVNDAGLLINPYNVGEIKRALDQVLTNEALREILIQKGLTRAKEFKWEKTAEKVLEGFNNL